MSRSADGIREVRCSACRSPMRPAPIKPIFKECTGMRHHLPYELQADGSKIVPVTLGARFGATHARKNILLHDNPCAVVTHTQPFGDCSKRHTPKTQFTKHSVLHRREVIPAFCASLAGNLRVTILEMHVQDTFAKTIKPIQDALAIDTARAEEVMPGIEDQP